MHIMTENGWKLLGGPLSAPVAEKRTWAFERYNPSVVSASLAIDSQQMNHALVRQFEEIAPTKYME